jgi:hypothetical protein
MTVMNVSSLTITQRATAMKKVMKEVRNFSVTRQVNDVLNTRNELSIILIHGLILNSSVLIFREDKNTNQSGSWNGSFKLLSMQDKSAIIELLSDSIKFR